MFAGLGRDVPSAEYLKWFTEGTCEATSRDDGGTTKDQCDAISRVDEGKTKDQHEATSRDDEDLDYDVCPRCGVYRVFAGMSEECCDQEFGMPCVFDMIKDHDPAPAEPEPRHDPAMAAVLTTKATSMATSAMPPVGTTMAAITMYPTAKDLCKATDTDEGTQQGSRRQRRTLGVTERRCRADGQRLRSLIGGCTCGACPHKQVLCRGVHAVVAGESARSESVHDRSSIWVLRPDELRKRVPEADQSAAWAERH